jgi:peptide/nickel transport system permease protein
MDNNLPPGSEGWGGMTYWLGTDPQGRDMLSAIIYGLRMSLIVGVTATLCALAIGMAIGMPRPISAAGSTRGDHARGRPAAVLSGDPRGADPAGDPRQGRGQGHHRAGHRAMGLLRAHRARHALVERRKDYIEAARCLAVGTAGRVPPPAAQLPAAADRGRHGAGRQAIALEATLSFLGVGVPITEPSLGLLIANGYLHAVGRATGSASIPASRC